MFSILSNIWLKGICDNDTALLIVRLSFALRFTSFEHVSHKVLPKGLQCPRYLTNSQCETEKIRLTIVEY